MGGWGGGGGGEIVVGRGIADSDLNRGNMGPLTPSDIGGGLRWGGGEGLAGITVIIKPKRLST